MKVVQAAVAFQQQRCGRGSGGAVGGLQHKQRLTTNLLGYIYSVVSADLSVLAALHYQCAGLKERAGA